MESITIEYLIGRVRQQYFDITIYCHHNNTSARRNFMKIFVQIPKKIQPLTNYLFLSTHILTTMKPEYSTTYFKPVLCLVPIPFKESKKDSNTYEVSTVLISPPNHYLPENGESYVQWWMMGYKNDVLQKPI